MEFIKSIINFDNIKGVSDDVNAAYKGLKVLLIISIALLIIKFIAPFIILFSKIPLVFSLFTIIISYGGIVFIKNSTKE